MKALPLAMVISLAFPVTGIAMDPNQMRSLMTIIKQGDPNQQINTDTIIVNDDGEKAQELDEAPELTMPPPPQATLNYPAIGEVKIPELKTLAPAQVPLPTALLPQRWGVFLPHETLGAKFRDDQPLAKTEFFIDGKLVAEGKNAAAYKGPVCGAGTHLFSAKATDTEGNYTVVYWTSTLIAECEAQAPNQSQEALPQINPAASKKLKKIKARKKARKAKKQRKAKS